MVPKDSFSNAQKKVCFDDIRYCLSHTSTSAFNARAIVSSRRAIDCLLPISKQEYCSIIDSDPEIDQKLPIDDGVIEVKEDSDVMISKNTYGEIAASKINDKNNELNNKQYEFISSPQTTQSSAWSTPSAKSNHKARAPTITALSRLKSPHLRTPPSKKRIRFTLEDTDEENNEDEDEAPVRFQKIRKIADDGDDEMEDDHLNMNVMDKKAQEVCNDVDDEESEDNVDELSDTMSNDTASVVRCQGFKQTIGRTRLQTRMMTMKNSQSCGRSQRFDDEDDGIDDDDDDGIDDDDDGAVSVDDESDED
jgi:hypothetical protein